MPIIKRALDLAVCIPSLVVAIPAMLVVAGMVYLTEGRPIIFAQKRPGLGGTIFTLFKFRTMRLTVDRKGRPLPDAQRLTGLGRFLRATSLDELPELVNVLRGEMSLVGPRPLLVEYLERYSPEQARRHDVLPGITGWAQINGRNALTWEEKFALDVWYVDHWSFWLDAKILFLTVWKVARREGINASKQVIMDEFRGSHS